MKIAKYSPLSHKINVLDLNVTKEQIAEWESPNARYVQDIFPNLTPGEREFLITGITPEEWDAAFGEDDE